MNASSVSTQQYSKTIVSKEIRKKIHDDWFGKKKYISLLVFKGDCPLSHHERLVYSFVTWLHRLDAKQSKPYSKIAARLSISESSVSSAAKSLENRGLVTVGTGRSNRAVIQLTDRRPNWLVIGNQGDPASNRMYQRATDDNSPCRLTSLDLSLLACLYGLAIKRGTLLIENTKSGLATLIPASTKTVRASLCRFELLGLARCVGNEIALQRPSHDALQHFADTGSTASSENVPQRAFEFDLETNEGIRLNHLLNEAQERQFQASWRDTQAFEFWKALFVDSLDGLNLNDRLALLEEFLMERYPALWLSAEEQHRETGKADNCRHLLAATAQDAIARLKAERGYS